MLAQRITSSIVLISALFASIFAGYPYFNLFFGLVIATMSWEWDKFINKKTTPFGVSFAFIALFCLFLPFADVGLKLRIPLIAIAVMTIAVYWFAKRKQYEYPKLLAFGVLYIALPALAINIIVSANSTSGIIWVLAISWMCDIGGYFVGCNLKGPKLCPSISPNKTWSGFLGGLGLACLFSYLFTTLQGLQWHGVYVLTIALGIIAVIGDLFESSIKRFMGVKDTSRFLPGHGGVFDRLDSTILVVVVYAILVVASDNNLIDMMIF